MAGFSPDAGSVGKGTKGAGVRPFLPLAVWNVPCILTPAGLHSPLCASGGLARPASEKAQKKVKRNYSEDDQWTDNEC